MNIISGKPVICAALLLIATCIVSGCSGSENVDPLVPLGMDVGSTTDIDEPISDDSNTPISVDSGADDSAAPTDENADSTTDEGSSGETESGTTDPNPVEPEPVATDPVVPDPAVQNTIRVDFQITVPAYSSKFLQLRLVWGSKNLTGTWVGDQNWTISDSFPTDAELPLSVYFYDGNGDVTLASFEQKFRTGTNAAEIYEISVDQFDTQRWDEDGDGVSNIDELNAGLNPLVNDTLNLEVREITGQNVSEIYLIGRFSGSFEWMLPEERPYFLHTEVDIPLTYEPRADGLSHVVTIDIAKNGTGSVYDKRVSIEPSNRHTDEMVATRTKTNSVITWAGKDYWYDSSAHRGEDVDFTIVSIVSNEQLRSQEGMISKKYIGVGYPEQSVSYTLTGIPIDDSPRCTPVSGSITFEGIFSLSTGNVESTTTISKTIDDEHWNVRVTTEAGHILDEYLSLNTGSTIYCNFL